VIDRLKRDVKCAAGISLSYKIKEDVMGNLFSSDFSSVSIEFYGNDIRELKDRGREVSSVLSELKGISRISSVLDRESPELLVEMDRERLSLIGFDVESISYAVALAVRGEVATRFREHDDEVDIKLRLAAADRSSSESISNIIIKSANGDAISLSAVASIKEAAGSVKITRREQSRINIVKAELLHGYTDVKNSIIAKLSETLRSRGVEYKIADGSAEISSAIKSIGFAMILALLFIYMLLAGQFQSLRNPLIIMLSIPVTLLGISAALLISGQTLNINSGIGIIMLCGTVVNNGIVLFSFIDNEMKSGSDIESAVIEAGKKRLQPILITSLTTVLAVVPIALGFGEGAEIQKPLAVTIIGGQALSTVLTLIVIPVIYAALEQRKQG
jgi:HAE1 family hydrophobic/amphiphilic exporter-1